METQVSIIMPALNAAATIKEAIDSVRTQSLQDWELIIIDNGSDDNTIEIARSYNDDRIKIISIDVKNVSRARNTGIDNAKGKYIGFLDADDYFGEESLTKRVEYLEKNPKIEAVFCETISIDENGKILQKINQNIQKITFLDFYNVAFHLNSLIIKKNWLEKYNFDENFKNAEDKLLLQRLARAGVVFHKVADCSVYYRIFSTSTVGKAYQMHEESILKVYDIIYGEDKDCSEPLERYRKGLKTPPKEKIITERLFSIYIYLFLAKEDSSNIVKRLKSLNRKHIAPKTYTSAISHAFFRYYNADSEQINKLILGKIPELFAFTAQNFGVVFASRLLIYVIIRYTIMDKIIKEI